MLQKCCPTVWFSLTFLTFVLLYTFTYCWFLRMQESNFSRVWEGFRGIHWLKKINTVWRFETHLRTTFHTITKTELLHIMAFDTFLVHHGRENFYEICCWCRTLFNAYAMLSFQSKKSVKFVCLDNERAWTFAFHMSFHNEVQGLNKLTTPVWDSTMHI